MQTSENINEIAAALAAAQGQFTGVSKDSSVNTGKYGYRYADLASYLDAIRQPMAANGLAIVQSPEIDNDRVTVTTMIVHASGQWLLSQLSMGVSDSRPQTLGGIITYCRRYALTAMLNLAAEDDDAQTEQAAKRQSSQPFQSSVHPEPAISQTTFHDQPPAELPRLTDWQRKALHAAGAAYYGKTWDEKRHALVLAITKGRTQSSADLTPIEANTLLDGINRRANEDAQTALTQTEPAEPF